MAQTVWRGHLTFGLVSFPVRLYKAARAEKKCRCGGCTGLQHLRRPSSTTRSLNHRLRRDRGRKRRSRSGRAAPAPPPEPEVFRTQNRIVAPSAPPPAAARGRDEDEEDAREFTPSSGELVKGYEYEKGRYVVLEDEELKSLVPETSKEMQVVEFVRLAEIDPIFFETSYYVVPDEAGQRPYSLLFEALREAEYVGLAQLAMHRREHIVVIRSGVAGLTAHTMFFNDEIRREQEYRADTADLNPRELDLAKRLIETMAVPFEPEKFRDTYRERLQQMIEAKVAGKEVAREKGAAPKAPAVIDIFDALQKSLNAMKKPARGSPVPRARCAKARTKGRLTSSTLRVCPSTACACCRSRAAARRKSLH